MKRVIQFFLIVCCLLLVVTRPALAQDEPELTISMSRDFGYASGTGDIQGLFSIKASGPDDLVRVEFLINDQVIGEDSEAPFKLQFNTDSFPNGTYTIQAVGHTVNGRELPSNTFTRNFVPAGEGMRAAGAIIGVILGILVIVMGVSFAITMISTRRKGAVPLGQSRNYGMKGGTICAKCGRPFAFHMTALNLATHKFDFCPHCGKWQLLRRVPLESLRQAEEAERQLDEAADVEQVEGLSEEEKLRRDLDASRFE